MAKRFTDTGKWDHSWFRKLTPKMKCAWFYLLDRCYHAGVWTVDFEAMSFHVGEVIEQQDLAIFGEKIRWIDADKIIISAFIDFQYGTLSEDCKPHKPVIDRLRKLNIETLSKGFPKGLDTLEEKEKEKEKEKEIKGECEGKKPEFDLTALCAQYPNRVNKAAGLARLKSQIRTEADFADFETALANYTRYLNLEWNRGWLKAKQWDVFVGAPSKTDKPWREWISPDPSVFENPNQKPESANSGQTDWKKEAAQIYQICLQHGFSLSPTVRDILGEQRVALVKAAGGVSDWKYSPNNDFTIKSIAERLKAASETLEMKRGA